VAPVSEPDTRFDSEQRDNAHPPGVEAIYWHRARNRILFRKLSKHLGPADSVLEVGCGPGVVVAYLRERGVACTGVDLAAQANIVPAARKHVEGGVDAFDLPQQRRAAVSALLLLDVLEHLPAPGDFLARCENRFPALRTILITLPARPEVWSTYDDYYGHYARYTLESLPQLGVPSSFRLLDCGYFFHGLYWAARAESSPQITPKIWLSAA